ncbi:oxidoreductase, aldo/keto reductase family protein [Gregarina niphandrodes]|uniref:Oxidoreductase, aldo/keto reductase family protein n=1 Tax=Gregarina niphandrodes TaxID=110365 RepID=A0A023B308_GRENI|nr:oxidoreductase, aldo/keto reductase family protein [Gregarina niphandrodes]EZG55318.1 oxidoreductase, aldo/keto reductase family protein [Gregarina niphandrodes]|eukprot:XP_011131641.1 oxidoreductase, aldo/keto reductase family protein [Gregarina niphandrodes]
MVGVLVKEFANGVMLPAVSLGCWQLYGDAPSTPVAVEAALKGGYYALDDAQCYNNEHVTGPIVAKFGKEEMKKASKFDPSAEGTPFKVVSEAEYFGSFEKPHGKPTDDRAVFVTTKIWCSNFDPAGIRKQVEQHLKDFQRSSIDLLLLHWPGNHVAWCQDESMMKDPKNAETRLTCWKTFEELYAEGKVRAIGLSNYMVQHLLPLVEDIKKRKDAGCPKARMPFVNQIEISAFCQVPEALEKLCKEYDITFTSYSSLGSAKAVQENISDKAIQTIADKHKVSPANVLIRWCMQKGYTVLPRSKHPERVQANYGPTLTFALDQDDMNAINKMNLDRRTGSNPHDIA